MKKRVGITLAVIGLIFFCYADGWAADWNWKKCGRSKNATTYYDTKGIALLPKGIVRVWGAEVYTAEGVQLNVQEFGQRYKDVTSGVTLIEINCRERWMRALSITFYSQTETVIDSESTPNAQWEVILPDSIGESLYILVCKESRY
jgi:hypothetical protein